MSTVGVGYSKPRLLFCSIFMNDKKRNMSDDTEFFLSFTSQSLILVIIFFFFFKVSQTVIIELVISVSCPDLLLKSFLLSIIREEKRKKL